MMKLVIRRSNRYHLGAKCFKGLVMKSRYRVSALLFAAFLLTSNCTPTSDEPEQAVAPATSAAIVDNPPLPAAIAAEQFSPRALNLMDAFFESKVANQELAHLSYRLVKDGEIVREGYWGDRTLDGTDNVDETTIHRIFSMTMPVTAVTLLALYEDGQFDLDDPITKFIPEFDSLRVSSAPSPTTIGKTVPMKRPPTMRELLTHTAGFTQNGFADALSTRFVETGVLDAPSGDAFVARMSNIPLHFQPGSGWRHSAASEIQGIIVERITGQRLGDVMAERVFRPLKMTDTAFSVPNDKRNRLAVTTRKETESSSLEAVTNTKTRLRAEDIPLDLGGRGLASTINDYSRFSQMLLNNGKLDGERVLKAKTVNMLRKNQLDFWDNDGTYPLYEPFDGVGYGFSVGVVTDTRRSGLYASEGTYFWDGATGCWFWIDPANDMYFVGMIQHTSDELENLRIPAMKYVYRSLRTNAPSKRKEFPERPSTEIFDRAGN